MKQTLNPPTHDLKKIINKNMFNTDIALSYGDFAHNSVFRNHVKYELGMFFNIHQLLETLISSKCL